jgi:hypothetical protein
LETVPILPPFHFEEKSACNQGIWNATKGIWKEKGKWNVQKRLCATYPVPNIVNAPETFTFFCQNVFVEAFML